LKSGVTVGQQSSKNRSNTSLNCRPDTRFLSTASGGYGLMSDIMVCAACGVEKRKLVSPGSNRKVINELD
jgi:hypothetical protein